MWHCFTCDYTNDTDVEDCWSCGTSRFSQFGDARLWDTIPSQVSSEQEVPVFEQRPVFKEVPVYEDIELPIEDPIRRPKRSFTPSNDDLSQPVTANQPSSRVHNASETAENVSQEQWHCFTCHYINEIEAKECWNCGTARLSQFGDAALWNAPPSKNSAEIPVFEHGTVPTRYSSEIIQRQGRKTIQKEEEDEPLLTIYTGSIRIGQILGLQLYCNFSLLLWLPCFWFELVPYSICVGVLFSTLVHEFSHVVASRWLGLKNGFIILWALAGYFISLDFERPLAQMNDQERYQYTLMTAAGPLSNLFLALIAGFVGYIFSLEQAILLAGLNLCVCAIHLLPIPSSDGEKLMSALTLSYGFSRQKIYKWLSILLFCMAIFSIFIDYKFMNDSNYVIYCSEFMLAGAIQMLTLRKKSDDQLEKEHQKEIQDAQEFILRKSS